MHKRTKTSLRRVNGHWAGVFHEHSWRTDVHVVWGLNGKQLKKYCLAAFNGEAPDDDDFVGCMLSFVTASPSTVVIAMKSFDGSIEAMDTLVHECVHVVHHVFKYRGLKLSDETEEAYAHLTGSLTSRSLELIKQARGKKRAP